MGLPTLRGAGWGPLLNIFLLDERHVGLYMLDVSGHGVAASLLSMAVSHFLTSHGDNSLLKLPAQGRIPARLARPREVVQRLNAQFSTSRSDQFFTLFYGHVDLASNTLTYSNAGHPGPVILAGGAEPSVLHSSGFPVGILEQAEYEGAEVRLRPGDRFWLYSDGLLEAIDFIGNKVFVRFSAAAYGSRLEGCGGRTMLP